MHVRDLVEYLVRDGVDGLDVWFDVYGRSSAAFGLARSCLNVLRVRLRIRKLAHEIVKSRGSAGCYLLRELALR